jgi:WD40 repeat protein
MGRQESTLDPAEGPVQRFAFELRKLRQEAGGITYRSMARVAGYSVATLSRAAGGEQLPSLPVALAYVAACGGDGGEWEQRWRAVDEESTTAAAAADDSDPPYQGLARFEQGDRERFFGRERLSGEVLALVRGRRFSAVFGPSGSGKSSLLRAGLIPALQTELSPQLRPAAIRILTPGPHPARAHSGLFTPKDGPGETVVVIDQFEEVFTLCTDPAERKAFIDLALTALHPDSRLRVVLAVRADFYGRCAEHDALAQALGTTSLLVGPMNPAELREAIVKPAMASGLIVEQTLTARIVEEVTGEPGGLPLMSHALLETWRRRKGRALGEAAYDAAGGIHGAIARTAEDVYTQLTPAQTDIARRILLRLITPGEGAQDTRRPVARAELDTDQPDDTAVVLERLARARLVTLDDDSVDLAHEALITGWPRLHAWIDTGRERLRTHRKLTEATTAWDDLGRDPGALYRGTRLAAAEEHFTGTPADLTTLERQFLTASTAGRSRERSRRRGFVVTLSVLLALALVAGVVAWQQNRTSDRRRVEAEARRIAAVADSMRFSDPVTAMKLSVAAWRLADTTETRSALIGAMAQREEDAFTVPGADSGPNDQSSNDVRRLTADGRYVVSVTADRVRTWNLRTHRLTLSAPGPGRLMDDGGPVGPVAVSPDGRTLAVSSGAAIKLWDARAARVTGTLPEVSPLAAPTFSLDGHTLVTEDWPADGNKSVQVWDLRAHRRILRIEEHGDEILYSAALSPDGRTLALCTAERSLEVWDTAHHRKASAPWAARVRPADCGSEALAIAPDGGTLALLDDSGIRRWDLRTGRKLPTLEADQVSDVRFSANGDFLVAMGSRALLMWRSAYPDAPVLTQRLLAGSLGDIAFDRTTGAVRYLNELGTVVRSLTLGRSTKSRWEKQPTSLAQLSGDGRVLARFRQVDGALRLQVVDTHSGRVIFEPSEDTCPHEDREDGASCSDLMALSPDGRYVAYSRGWNTTGQGLPDKVRITVWDVRTRRARATVGIRPEQGELGDSFGVNGLALDDHARHLVVYRAMDPTSAEVWDLSRKKRVRSVRGSRATGSTSFSSFGWSPALNPGGDILVTTEGVVAELRAGGRVEPHLLGEDMSTAAAFSPDGRYLAAGDDLGYVTLWNGTLRKRLGMLDGDSSDAEADTVGSVTSLAFSHDGSTLAVAGDAGTVQLWDVSSSRLLGSKLPTPGDQALALAFSPDDGTLYAAGTNVPVQKYDLTPGHLITTVCKRTGSGLSKSDWKTYLPNVPYRRTC